MERDRWFCCSPRHGRCPRSWGAARRWSWDSGFGKAAPVREAINAALGPGVTGTSCCVLEHRRGVPACPLERSLCTPGGCELQSWALPTQTLPTLLAVTRRTWARTWGRGYGTSPYTKGAVSGFYKHQGTVNASNLLLSTTQLQTSFFLLFAEQWLC